MITILFILFLIIDFIWIIINWGERFEDRKQYYTEGSLCIFECLFLIFGVWWLTL